MTEFKGSIPEINIEGFQVVSGDLFTCYARYYYPCCTLWPTSLSFNKASLNALNNCERVRIEIHPTKKCMLVIPVTVKDRDSLRWITGVKEPQPRKIDCKAFTSKLYEVWGLDEALNYKTTGIIVSSENKIMLLYDFNNASSWKQKRKGEEIVGEQ